MNRARGPHTTSRGSAAEAPFKVVPGPSGDPERRLIAGADLQPDPRRRQAAVSPRRRGPHGPGRDCAASLLGPHPVGQLDAPRAVGHQPHRADEPAAPQDSQTELAAGGGIPGRQRRPGVVQRVRSGRARAPQGRLRLTARGLGQQRGIVSDQDPHAQVVAEIQLRFHARAAARPVTTRVRRGQSLSCRLLPISLTLGRTSVR